MLGLVAVPASQAFVASALGSSLKVFFNLAIDGLGFVLRPLHAIIFHIISRL